MPGISYDEPRIVWILELQSSDPRLPEKTKKYLENLLPGSFIHRQEMRLVIISPAASLREGFANEEAFSEGLMSGLDREFPESGAFLSCSKICSNLRYLFRACSEAKFSMIIGPKLSRHSSRRIHRNTLYKRIEKIRQVLDMDMYDAQNHILLCIALKIDHIREIFPKTESNASWTLQ